MTTRRPRDDPEWRAFEQLVARIEQDAGHTGVTVISPDRIRCRVTGRLREVDASIRDAAGNLTTVECRQRRGRQDVTWIEQLATKRISLGAICTIAVSATGFSAAAHQIALAHGMLLKEVRAIDEAELNPFMGLDLVHFSHRRAAIVSVGLRFATSTDWTVPNDGELDMAMPEDVDLSAPIFRNVDEGHSWSINDIWHQLQASADPFAGLAKGAAPVVRGACFPYPAMSPSRARQGSSALAMSFSMSRFGSRSRRFGAVMRNGSDMPQPMVRRSSASSSHRRNLVRRIGAFRCRFRSKHAIQRR